MQALPDDALREKAHAAVTSAVFALSERGWQRVRHAKLFPLLNQKCDCLLTLRLGHSLRQLHWRCLPVDYNQMEPKSCAADPGAQPPHSIFLVPERKTLMIRTLSLFALALPAFSALMIGPITTTGHVSYVIGSLSSGSGQTVSASGSDGQNSIAIYINDGITPTSGYPFFSHHRYNNSIGTSFSFVNNIRYFDFDAYFGGTQGRLIIYASNTPTIIVDFVGYSVNSMNFTDITGLVEASIS